MLNKKIKSHHELNGYFGGRKNAVTNIKQTTHYERIRTQDKFDQPLSNFADFRYVKQISMNRREFEVTTVNNEAFAIPFVAFYGHFQHRPVDGPFRKVVTDPRYYSSPVVGISEDGSFRDFKNVRDVAVSKNDIAVIDKNGCILVATDQSLSFSKLQIEGNPVFNRISGSTGHFAAVTEDGQLYTWGKNDRGQCGHAIYDYTIDKPRRVESLPENILYSASSPFFTVVVTESRSLYVFGTAGEENYKGFVHKDRPQDNYLRIYQPRMLPLPYDAKVSQVAVGTRHILVLTNKSQLLLWHYFELDGKHKRRKKDDWSQLSNSGVTVCRIFSNDHFFGSYNISLDALTTDQNELFNQAMTEMLTNREKFPTDFTLIVKTKGGGQALYPIHKIVLFARSEAFNQLFECDLNLQNDSFEIKEDDFSVVETKINVLYTGVPFGDSNLTSTRYPLLKQAHTDMYNLISFTLDDAIKNHCDVALEIEDQVIYCHKLILKGTPYFESMLRGSFTESQTSLQQPIQIINYSYSTILTVITFLYSRDASRYIDASNCVEVLLCAHEFNIKELEPVVISIIAINVDNESVESVLDVAERYNHSSLSLWCKLYMSAHLDELKDLESSTKRLLNDFMFQ
ncbi:RCC1 and BTB domain-containing protein [Acrasis kona]|uniref:RCC1 and BTB domain-containing protein n=1 Tax=Acrasis kona TaxID=1008807 RepID=A0AAW2Z630_9EUKA